MSDTATILSSRPSVGSDSAQLDELRQAIEHAAHLLPSQAPISVFVHHNTLHAFEDLPFEQAVKVGSQTFGCHAFLPEARYRRELERGRIYPEDLAIVLMEDLDDEADRLIGFLATRYHLRLSMLQYPLRQGTDAEVRWLIAESDALRTFLPETALNVREQMVGQTRRWVMRDLRNGGAESDPRIRSATATLFDRFGKSQIEHWSTETWSAFTLHLLWYVCHAGVHGVRRFTEPAPIPVRHRDVLFAATGIDADRSVNELLIRFCAAFLDQGIADWTLPHREEGFWKSWQSYYAGSRPVEGWLRDLPAELERIQAARITPLESIRESLDLLGVSLAERQHYLERTLLALPGWAGMIWQMDTAAKWVAHPIPSGTLVEYLAVRLILERLALGYFAPEDTGHSPLLRDFRSIWQKRIPHEERVSVEQRAFLVFQLAQHLGWKPADLYGLSKAEWSQLVQEIETFNGPERRRIYHLAFERRYRTQVLDAIVAHATLGAPPRPRPSFQLITCLDEREESFRRHLEEITPECETFSLAGFFGVAMYYRGVADAHFVPLCPVVIQPKHYVQEEVGFSFQDSHRRRAETRRALGKASHRLHTQSRSALGGALAAIFGPLASVPLVARVLFPRLTAKTRRLIGGIVQPPPVTQLQIERCDGEPGPEPGRQGYTLEEMVAIAERVLRDIGLTSGFSRLVIIAGHGSSSLNNPHNSAYDCGACGGGRGGPNARALASMLADPRVRYQLASRGLEIPLETLFVGAFHNTCDDSLQYFDLDRIPATHRLDLERARRALDEARQRNAHERCRRFESAELSLTPEAALRHVENRSEDLSQTRPECGHATNAICIVGRRSRTQSLYLDRRAFLTSYDPTQDDEEATILTRTLQAVIPVCAGINLEYYFCYVDPTGYGCGSKLPHNITSLIGVMDGAASDLRSGLPWQMVEIHEPVRLLFILETTPDIIERVLERNPPLAMLVRNEWVQLATLAPDSPSVQLYRHGKFTPYRPESTDLPIVDSSQDWYRGWRDHLSCARIAAPPAPVRAISPGDAR